MVTPQKPPKSAKNVGFWLFLGMISIATSAYAQRGDAYRVVIKMGHGALPVTGFLYAVNDTAVVLLPSVRLTPKDLKVALEKSPRVSIPTRVIKKVKITKARSYGHDFGMATLFALGYGIAYIAVFPLDDPIDLVPYTLVVGTATVITMDLIYSRKYKPTDPAFTMLMQKYCLKNNGLVVDR